MPTQRAKVFRFVCILMLTLTALYVPPHATRAAAPIRYVTPHGTGDCSSWATACNLQQALTQAVSHAELWVAQGIYYPDEGIGQTDNAPTSTFSLTLDIAMYGGFAGTETSRAQRDWTLHPTILSGDLEQNDVTAGGVVTDTHQITGTNAYHVVYTMGVTSTTLLDGVTITAGYRNGNYFDTYYGGGMYNELSSPTLNNIIFSGNYASSGGGMANINSAPTLNNITFNGNYATWGGGGMFNNFSNPTLNDVTFSGNTAFYAGGGIYNQSGNLTLNSTTFNANTSSNSGGGIYNADGSLTLINVTFKNNAADYSGGGMYSQYGGTVRLISSAVINNRPDGLGIGNGTNLNIERTTISGNSGYGITNPFGMYGSPNTTLITASTIISNTQSDLMLSGTTSVEQSIIGTCAYEPTQGGILILGNYNLVQATGSCRAQTPNLTNRFGDPQLGPLADHGGPTPTLLPLPNSPALDRIPADRCATSTDQRGISRPQGNGCDIGAVEIEATASDAPPLVSMLAISYPAKGRVLLSALVTPQGSATDAFFAWGTTSNLGTTTPPQSLGSGNATRTITTELTGLDSSATYYVRVVATNAIGQAQSDLDTFIGEMNIVHTLADSGPGSLRQAITDAADGSTITFAVSGTLNLTSPLVIAKPLTISGPGTDQLTITGGLETLISLSFAGQVSIQDLSMTQQQPMVALDATNDTQLTLDGIILSGSGDGAGIRTYGGTLSVHNSLIRQFGTAMFMSGSQVSIDTSTLRDNSTAIDNYYGPLTISSSLITNNDITITPEYSSNTTTIISSTIQANRGDGLAITSGDFIIRASTISQNGGNGISASPYPYYYYTPPNVRIERSTITGNQANGIVNSPAYYSPLVASISLVASTVISNSASSLAASTPVSGTASDLVGTATLTQTILGTCGQGTVTLEGYNLIGDQTGCTLLHDDFTNRFGDPQLAPLSDQGGPTPVMLPLPSSPARDAIPPAACATRSDQRGTPRPIGDGCDIGASELPLSSAPLIPYLTTLPLANPPNADGSATLNGFVVISGTQATASFVWGIEPQLDHQTTEQPLAADYLATPITALLTNLQPNTFYTYRLVVATSTGRFQGQIQRFFSGPDPVVYVPQDGMVGSLRQVLTNAPPNATITFAITGALPLNQGTLVFSKPVTLAGPGSSQLQLTAANNQTNVALTEGISATIRGLSVVGGDIGIDVGAASQLELDRAVVRNAQSAGIASQGTITLTQSSILYNTTGIQHSGSLSGTLTLRQSSVISNTADGLVVADAGSAQLFQSTVSNNGSYGIVFYPTTGLTISGSTVAGNAIGDLAGNASIEQSIVQNCASGQLTLGGYTLVNPNTCTITGDVIHNRTGDPLLNTISSTADQPPFRPLATFSPVRDVIPPDHCIADTDQRGVTRPQGSGCDIGAVEMEQAAPPAPFVELLPLERTNPTSLTLQVLINPNGATTDVIFEWGTSNTFGNATPPQTISAESATITVTGQLESLTPNTVYFVRVTATSMHGSHSATQIVFTGNGPNVYTLNDSGGGSLREAINIAKPGDSITFVVSGEIVIEHPLIIEKDLIIPGPGIEALTIGSSAQYDPVFQISAGVSATISHLTLTGGAYGLMNEGTLTATDILIHNSSYAGVRNNGTMQIIRSTIEYNGSGISNEWGAIDLTVTDSTIRNNQWAGIYQLSGRIRIHNSTIANQQLGIAVNGGTGELINSTITSAGQYDEGFMLYDATPFTITASTIINDGFMSNGITGAPRVQQSIVSSCAPSYNTNQSIVSLGDNLFGPMNTCALSATDHVGDIYLNPLANNGGPTFTRFPPPASPAIDAIPAERCATTSDQRGSTRPQHGACDIGAVEVELNTAFSTTGATVSEGSGALPISITLSIAPTTPVTVGYASSDGSISGNVTFPVSTTLQSITLPISDNQINEPTRHVTITLEPPVGVGRGSNATFLLTILDNDPAVATLGSNGGTLDAYAGDLIYHLTVPSGALTTTTTLTITPEQSLNLHTMGYVTLGHMRLGGKRSTGSLVRFSAPVTLTIGGFDPLRQPIRTVQLLIHQGDKWVVVPHTAQQAHLLAAHHPAARLVSTLPAFSLLTPGEYLIVAQQTRIYLPFVQRWA